MKKIFLIMSVGTIAGLLDLIPLVLVRAPVFNMLSIIAFWLVDALIVSTTRIFKNSIINGLSLSILLMFPMALAVSATNPSDFIPMLLMSAILGPIVGFAIGIFTTKS